jgi:hypothetical protein
MELPAGVSTSTYTYAGTGYANPHAVTYELIRAGLATAQTESVVARSRTLEVARVRITKAGRMILTGR